MANISLIKETLQDIVDQGYMFTISGTKFDKTVLMVKNGRGILLYKGFFQKGQQYHSHPGAFKLAEKINKRYAEEGRLCQVTPALLRSHIIDIAKPVNKVKATF